MKIWQDNSACHASDDFVRGKIEEARRKRSLDPLLPFLDSVDWRMDRPFGKHYRVQVVAHCSRGRVRIEEVRETLTEATCIALLKVLDTDEEQYFQG